ncbi:MAG: porin family protein [Bacteroidota bacterium]|nr:porin family protein [Bacteroidota bacterium]
MKKLFFTLLLAFLPLTFSFSQFSFGAKFGLNFSNQTCKDNNQTYSDDYKSRIGWVGELLTEYSFKEKFAVQLAAGSVSKGFKRDYNGVKYTYALSYINIEPSFIYKYKLNNISLFGQAGPYLSMLGTGTLKADKAILGPKGDSKSTGIDMGSDKEKDVFKSGDYGVNFGAGVEFLKNTRVGIQYSMGLDNIALSTDNGAKINNHDLTIFLNFKF